jgi:histone deacetylase 11
MKLSVFYHPRYNIDLGLLNRLHPFDGLKFKKVYDEIRLLEGVELIETREPVTDDEINRFVDSLQKLLLKKKRYILRALEVPYIPFIPFSWIDKKILLPMRYGVGGTMQAARHALQGNNCWNLSGGYHHASRSASEGFCVYNDIGMTIESLRHDSVLNTEDKILIVDTDAHHGNGNAYVFEDDRTVALLDIYNDDIYPNSPYTKERIDINLPIRQGTGGVEYLNKLREGLATLSGDYKLAFVIAGTDVLKEDPLGGLNLSMEDCANRDVLVAEKLLDIKIPFVFTGGGGYSTRSAEAITRGVRKLSTL